MNVDNTCNYINRSMYANIIMSKHISSEDYAGQTRVMLLFIIISHIGKYTNRVWNNKLTLNNISIINV